MKCNGLQIGNIFSSFSNKKGLEHFMQIVSLGDNLHEMSNPVFWEKYFKV